jgi:hypothetical protein
MPLIAPLFAFGDSVIDAFNPTTWAFEGSIDVKPGSGNAPGGLWSLAFGGGGKHGNPNTLFFTDGIDGETAGSSVDHHRPGTFHLGHDAGRIWRTRALRRSKAVHARGHRLEAKAKGTALKSASARWR